MSSLATDSTRLERALHGEFLTRGGARKLAREATERRCAVSRKIQPSIRSLARHNEMIKSGTGEGGRLPTER